jgi:hypothetical protein
MSFLFYKSAYDYLAVAAWQPSGEHVRAALPFFILFSTVHDKGGGGGGNRVFKVLENSVALS